eukprot:scaffold256751_cov21-Tisochrysis_lutea.AAC.1
MSRAVGAGDSSSDLDLDLGILDPDSLSGGCSSGFLKTLPVGSKCGAAKGEQFWAPEAWEKCSAKPVAAKASNEVDYTNPGAPIIRLSSEGSTPCLTCAAIDCGKHGFCKPIGPKVLCSCKDGYSGDRCQVPPEACYNRGCSDAGICYVNVDNKEKCACLPGRSGSDCEIEDSSSPSPSSSSTLSPVDDSPTDDPSTDDSFHKRALLSEAGTWQCEIKYVIKKVLAFWITKDSLANGFKLPLKEDI